MTIIKRKKTTRKLLVFMLMIFNLYSCTYDYFEDENNFRLYVPQIENGSIQNFYVSFHDKNGNHTITRQIEAPFDKDEILRQGILRFKLYPGEYYISCFADYTAGSITEGINYNSSSKNKDAIDLSNNVYTSRNSNPRSLYTIANAFPIGHPDAKEPVTINIDEKQCFKGKLRFVIDNLPDIITRIDIFYKGLATKYYFSGLFDSFSPNDKIMASINVADYRVNGSIDFTDIINPSIGTSFGTTSISPFSLKAANPTPMEFMMYLYDSANNIVGTVEFNTEILSELQDDKKPKDVNGNPIENLILMPQSTINFRISGFTIIKIELVGWNDTNQGEITPL